MPQRASKPVGLTQQFGRCLLISACLVGLPGFLALGLAAEDGVPGADAIPSAAVGTGGELLAWFRYFCVPLPEAFAQETASQPLPDPASDEAVPLTEVAPCFEEGVRGVCEHGRRLAIDVYRALAGQPLLPPRLEPTPAPAALVISAPLTGREGVIEILIEAAPRERTP